jgi:hypothetical protein
VGVVEFSALDPVLSSEGWLGSVMPRESKAERAALGTVTPAKARPASTSGIRATAIPTLATNANLERGVRRCVRVSASSIEARAAWASRGTRSRPSAGSGRMGTAVRSELSNRATSFISPS